MTSSRPRTAAPIGKVAAHLVDTPALPDTPGFVKAPNQWARQVPLGGRWHLRTASEVIDL